MQECLKSLVALLTNLLLFFGSAAIAEILIDKLAHIVTVDGHPIELSFKEFELLTYFVTNKGVALSREKILNNVSFTLGREDKVAFVGGNEQAKTMLFKILTGEEEADEGSFT